MKHAAKPEIEMLLGRIAVLEFRVKAVQWLFAGLAIAALMIVFSRPVEGEGSLRTSERGRWS